MNDTTTGNGLKFGKTLGTTGESGAAQPPADNKDVQNGAAQAGLAPPEAKPADTVTQPQVGKADVEGLRGHQPLDADSAAALAGEGPGVTDDSRTWTSHPVANFNMGKFAFEQGRLTLKGDEAAEFEKLLNEQPIYIKNQVKELDLGAANARAAAFAQSRMSRGIDTASVGRNANQG